MNGQSWRKATLDLPMSSVVPCMSMEDFSQVNEQSDFHIILNCGERNFQSPYNLNGKPVPGAIWLAQGEQVSPHPIHNFVPLSNLNPET